MIEISLWLTLSGEALTYTAQKYGDPYGLEVSQANNSVIIWVETEEQMNLLAAALDACGATRKEV